MAEKFNSDESLTAQELASQARKPDGEIGKVMGFEMNKSNQHICINSYLTLDPEEGDNILEIGMGNGFFIKDLLDMASDIRYTGVDFSTIMIEEATILNQGFIDEKRVQLLEASIEDLPFNNGQFNAITTTNTLYFWPDSDANAAELMRVLRPGGKLLVSYRNKNCMDQLEFTQHGFTKYDFEDVEKLLSDAGCTRVSTLAIDEPELEFEGQIHK